MSWGQPPGNDNARRNPGARENDSKRRDTQPQPESDGNKKDYENKRNAAACFKNQKKTEDWHADFVGVAVVEGLRDGDKVWVNVHLRTSRKGEDYVSIVLRPQK
jgi:hypothetical protein